MAERQGEREEMQDAHVIINDVLSRQFISSLPNKMYVNVKICYYNYYKFFCLIIISQRIAYYGVFDGHGGLRASKFTSENLHNNILTKLPKGVASYGVMFPCLRSLSLFICCSWTTQVIPLILTRRLENV